MTEEDRKAFNKAKKSHICKKDLIRHNAKDEIEVWDPETGEYCGKVHKFKKAPLNSKKRCHKEVLELMAIDQNGKLKTNGTPESKSQRRKVSMRA